LRTPGTADDPAPDARRPVLLQENPPSDSRTSARTLLVASTGGHLSQLHALAPRIPGLTAELRTWVTFDTPQSRSLLAGEDVVFVNYTAPRDWRNTLRNLAPAWKLLSEGDFGHVVSTGSGIALTFLPLARARRMRVTYVESAARSQGPSLTGRILARVPGVRLGTQYTEWANGRWSYVGSVLDEYVPVTRRYEPSIRNVVLTLGTIPYDFRRLVERTLQLLPPDARVTFQTGVTDVSDLPIAAQAQMPGHELKAAIKEADVVIAHAGAGSALAALEAGKCAVLVPREMEHGEHVDDHQHQIGEELARRGLAIHRKVGELTWEDLQAAARVRVNRVSAPPLLIGPDDEPIADSQVALGDDPAPLPVRPRTGRFQRQRQANGATQQGEGRSRYPDLERGLAGARKAPRGGAHDERPVAAPLE
jgi:UDP-N-acetylglucosamine--N-acetylmuramyl-(pentapeptide) pyrophosphoryl-undecaprenol N-acetylglucosamine transferase